MRFAEVTDTDDGRISSGIFGHFGHCFFLLNVLAFSLENCVYFQIQLENFSPFFGLVYSQ